MFGIGLLIRSGFESMGGPIWSTSGDLAAAAPEAGGGPVDVLLGRGPRCQADSESAAHSSGTLGLLESLRTWEKNVFGLCKGEWLKRSSMESGSLCDRNVPVGNGVPSPFPAGKGSGHGQKNAIGF